MLNFLFTRLYISLALYLYPVSFKKSHTGWAAVGEENLGILLYAEPTAAHPVGLLWVGFL